MEALQDGLGLIPITAQILVRRGIDTVCAAQSFLDPSLDELHSPFAFVQMEPAVERLLVAIERGERIVVHGDYDVDGITGTVVLLLALRAIGADIDYLVPHRVEDGYGLKPQGVDRAHKKGAKVLIAVDCGTTDYTAAARARELDIDLIIVDHHEPGDEIPEATAILNPRLPGAGYPEHDMAAVAVAFKLVRGVLERHSQGLRGTTLLKLVALGTVADMVPLTGENRVIAYHGLQTMGETVNPGLRALMDFSGVRGHITSTDIGFRIAPRINAVGRIGHPKDAVEMFLADDPGEARRLAELLHKTNVKRKKIQDKVVDEALKQKPSDTASVVVAAGEWNRGVIGIVAARLVQEWGRPAVVIAIDETGAVGSARSIPGFDIVGALRKVADLLEEFGGHPQAAGVTIRAENVEPLREALALAGGKELELAMRHSEEITCDAELEFENSLSYLARELERLGPFGIGNPQPRLLCRDLRVESQRVLKEQHLKLRVACGKQSVDAIAWRRSELAEDLTEGTRFDAVAELTINKWAGRSDPQLELLEVNVDGPVTIA